MAELSKETPQGEFIVAEKSGHNIQLEEPAVMIDAIRAMLETASAD